MGEAIDRFGRHVSIVAQWRDEVKSFLRANGGGKGEKKGSLQHAPGGGWYKISIL